MGFDWKGLLYPRRCPVCQEVVEQPGALACDICRTKLIYVREPYCMRCGKQLTGSEREYCADCARRKHSYFRGRSAFVYEEHMRRSIAGFKYGGRQEYAAFYAEELLRRCARDMLSWRADALIPIPLHPKRQRKRGYNQAALLAAELSKRSGIPSDEGCLARVKNTVAQKELGAKERLSNLKEAFQARRDARPYRNVILVDDIYTTGSTMDAAARVLRENGVQTVYFLCISVGSGS